MKIKVLKTTVRVEDDGSFLSKLMLGCKGNIRIKTPLGDREIKKVTKMKENRGEK